jgi:hypothetical protein
VNRAFALAVLAAGCWGGKQVRPAAPAPPLFRIEIAAARDSNQGGPLVVVVRKVDRAGFLAEDYDAIADGLFNEPRDPAVLRKAIVRPGEKVTVEVPRASADGEVLGVYFLFSTPGDDWRLAVGDDPGVSGLRVVLGASGVDSVEERR